MDPVDVRESEVIQVVFGQEALDESDASPGAENRVAPGNCEDCD